MNRRWLMGGACVLALALAAGPARTDFLGNLFEGSLWLLAWADNLIELKTICHCGRKATMVLRLVRLRRIRLLPSADGPAVETPWLMPLGVLYDHGVLWVADRSAVEGKQCLLEPRRAVGLVGNEQDAARDGEDP